MDKLSLTSDKSAANEDALVYEPSLEYAQNLDTSLPSLRSHFSIPPFKSGEAIYLCGNSLGLLPKATPGLISQELNVWATRCRYLTQGC
jgi:kynureninase